MNLLQSPWAPLVLLGLLPLLLYWDLLASSTQPQIDDKEGIFGYDGKLQMPWRWHHVFRYVRWQMAKQPNPNRNWELSKQPAFGQDIRVHHRFSLWMLGATAACLYLFLAHFVPTSVAFLTCLLFLASPLTCQVTAWISGIGYLVATFFTLTALNWVWIGSAWTDPYLMLLSFGIFAALQWMAVEAHFVTVGSCLILLGLHQWPYAVIAGLLAIYGCLNTFREAVTLRTKTFTEQNMGRSTKLYAKKLFLVFRLLAYNVRLILFPKRMGLYHTFGYHYELPYVEWTDAYFWSGVALFAGSAWALVVSPLPLQLAIVWFYAYYTLFGGWVIANQIVAERYVWLPAVGFYLAAALLLPTWAMWLVIGVALARSWAHLPTYYTEIQFYLSNLWNFPDSEVAIGNLGVTWISQGLVSSALEHWVAGARMNPRYDVNWYNLSTMIKTRGLPNPNYVPTLMGFPESLVPVPLFQDASQHPPTMHLKVAKWLLEQAVSAPQCHFKDKWKMEIQEIEHMIRKVLNPVSVNLPRYQQPVPA